MEMCEHTLRHGLLNTGDKRLVPTERPDGKYRNLHRDKLIHSVPPKFELFDACVMCYKFETYFSNK